MSLTKVFVYLFTLFAVYLAPHDYVYSHLCVYIACCDATANYIVFRLEKLKPKLPKLNIVPANEAIDPSCIVRRPIMAASPTPSPSPSPVPQEYIDPDFDPDNVVIRGAPTDDEEDDDDEDNRTDARGGNGMSDFTFNTHS